MRRDRNKLPKLASRFCKGDGTSGRGQGFEFPTICTPEEFFGGIGMTLKDEIVEEVRKAREANAAQLNYDLAEMYADLKAREQQRSNVAAC